MIVRGFSDSHPSPFRAVSSGWVAVWLQSCRQSPAGPFNRQSQWPRSAPVSPVQRLEARLNAERIRVEAPVFATTCRGPAENTQRHGESLQTPGLNGEPPHPSGRCFAPAGGGVLVLPQLLVQVTVLPGTAPSEVGGLKVQVTVSTVVPTG